MATALPTGPEATGQLAKWLRLGSFFDKYIVITFFQGWDVVFFCPSLPILPAWPQVLAPLPNP
jgi:hypothetical protein